MTNKERRKIKSALIRCAEENENRTYAKMDCCVICVSSICRSAKERIEELEKQVRRMKNCFNCSNCHTNQDKCRECHNESKWRLRDD